MQQRQQSSTNNVLGALLAGVRTASEQKPASSSSPPPLPPPSSEIPAAQKCEVWDSTCVRQLPPPADHLETLLRSPEALAPLSHTTLWEMLKNPMVSYLIDNPEVIRGVGETDPQLRRVLETYPNLKEALRDGKTVEKALKRGLFMGGGRP